MKVLAVNGSARKNGNTQALVEAALEPLRAAGIEVESISLAGLTVGGCTACARCKKEGDGRCYGRDDDLNPILPKVWEADALILASPVYFADVTAEMKAFIDRVGYIGRTKSEFLSRKIGAPLVVARRAGAIHALDTISHLFSISDMVTVGSSYWPVAYGAMPGDVSSDEEGIRTAKRVGDNMVWLLEKLAV